MAVRFYIVPAIGTGTLRDVIRRKYISDWAEDHPGDLDIVAEWKDYGLERVFLVGAEVTVAQHTELTSQLDVIAVPQNLDAQVSLTALTTIQNKLEGLNIPADLFTTANTYRDVLRVLAKLFRFMATFHGREKRVFFESGITLDTRINQLTQAQRAALQDAATSLGLDVSSITGAMLLRRALRLVADQLPAIVIMGETF